MGLVQGFKDAGNECTIRNKRAQQGMKKPIKAIQMWGHSPPLMAYRKG